jgi:protein-S-isoprenylcysteine O-methyltransferase Ste14
MSIISSLSLKDSWRIGVCGNEKNELITSGVYRFSRNPYFLSFDCVLIGMVFYAGSLVILIPAIITILFFNILILKEEKYLEKQHGDVYRKYKQQVRRYI